MLFAKIVTIFNLGFGLQVLWRAYILTVSWMGTSLLAVVAKIIVVPSGILLAKIIRHGLREMYQRFKENIKDTVLGTAIVWTCLVIFNALYTVPKQIKEIADSVVVPRLKFGIPTPPPTYFVPVKNNTAKREKAPGKEHPPIVQMVTPSYGNLKMRCNKLAAEVEALAVHRDEVEREFSDDKTMSGAEKLRRYQIWHVSNWIEFRTFLDRVIDMQQECAKHDIRDDELERLIAKMRELSTEPLLPMEKMRGVGSFDIHRIAGRLKVLADQIPQ